MLFLAFLEILFKKTNFEFQRILIILLQNISFPKSFLKALTLFLAIQQSQSKHSRLVLQKNFFKACVRYFLTNFYLSPNDSPSKTMKDVFYFI